MRRFVTIAGLLCLCFITHAQRTIQADVLVVGGGTGGTAAGIQSARLGARTLIAEPTPWLGGMISAAGVSAIDGNHRLPSGLWSEFRSRIYQVYGGPAAVETGWVSNTQFEPHVADSIFKSMARAEKNLTVLHGLQFAGLSVQGKKIQLVRFRDAAGTIVVVRARVVIDATELGDVLKAAGVPYDLGMEADAVSGETVGIEKSSDIVQDLTYVAILKDYGKADPAHLLPRPAGYDPAEFDGASTDYYRDTTRKKPGVDAQKMLDYGKLPRGKYMINWPNYGNDTYLNIVERSPEQRERELIKAKETTLRFVYFIQQQLGFTHLGLADDEFPTSDRLALMPYHREGRRVRGLVRFTMRHIAEPFTYGDALYRTGISVGDYPIDHHHKKNPEAPQHLEFYPIPSFSVPLGALIPQGCDNLIIAEKAISVSNVANGTTRLQPCVLLTGQAAGTLAAESAKRKLAPALVPVRPVQEQLLRSRAYLLPYIDVSPEDRHFAAIQRMGATGILRGKGIPYKWANQTWFYPDSLITPQVLMEGMSAFAKPELDLLAATVPVDQAIRAAYCLKSAQARKDKRALPGYAAFLASVKSNWTKWGLKDFRTERSITRRELAVLLDETAAPFRNWPVDHRGRLIN